MEKKHLPIYGVGPFYGAGVIVTGLAGVGLSLLGVLDGGLIHGAGMWVMIVLGLLFLAGGLLLWAPAALGRESIDGYIRSNTLCTTGVYGLCRNPCYSGIMLSVTGGILLAHNLYLLPLPPLYWLAMTVLMKCTEEKWLTELYGEAYREYCRKVNRCIPWFPR